MSERTRVRPSKHTEFLCGFNEKNLSTKKKRRFVMNPGIQLMLRMERDAQAQRRSSVLYRDNLEKLSRPLEQDNRIQRFFNMSRREQRCECVQ
jgi:hypothetical protein